MIRLFIYSRRENIFYLFGKDLISCFSRANVRVFHENPDRMYTVLTFIIKSRVFLVSAGIFETSSKNSLDPDQFDMGPYCLPLNFFN